MNENIMKILEASGFKNIEHFEREFDEISREREDYINDKGDIDLEKIIKPYRMMNIGSLIQHEKLIETNERSIKTNERLFDYVEELEDIIKSDKQTINLLIFSLERIKEGDFEGKPDRFLTIHDLFVN